MYMYAYEFRRITLILPSHFLKLNGQVKIYVKSAFQNVCNRESCM